MNDGLVLLGVLVVVLLEQAVLRWRARRAPDWDEVASNLHSGHIVVWVSRSVEIVVYGWVLVHAGTGWAAGWPVAVQWLAAFLLWDLMFYWMHVAHHKVPVLWSVHKVHHQGQRMDLSLGVRNGWYSSLTNVPFVIPLAVLGIPLPMFVAVSTILYAHQLFNHCGLVDKLGWLDRFLVTPNNHRVHHFLDRRAFDKNFGGTLLLWDKLFGSFQAELPDMVREYGLHEGPAPANPLLSNHDALRRRYPPRDHAVGGIHVGIGSALLFCVVAYSAWRFPGMPDPLLGTALAAGAISLGAISDGSRWGWPGWITVALLVLPVWFYFHANDMAAQLLQVAFVLHGAVLVHAATKPGWRR